MIGRDHHPGQNRLAQGREDLGCNDLARAGAEGDCVCHQLDLEVSGDGAAAIRAEHGLHLGQKALKRFCCQVIPLAPRNGCRAVPGCQFVERRLNHPTQRPRRETPVLPATLSGNLLNLRVCVAQGIAHSLCRTARYLEFTFDIGKANPLGRSLHHERQFLQLFLTGVTHGTSG